MLLVGVKEQNGWLLSRWNLTYRVGWEQICKAAQSVFDYYQGLEILVDDRAAMVADKAAVTSLQEGRTLTIRGMSKIIGSPLMITFYNQTNAVDVNVVKGVEEFKEADYESFNKSLCQYLDSMELAMHR